MNADLLPPIIPPVAHQRTMTPKPSFLLVLRGIWLFTWANEFNWRRLPLRLISLLVLPFLVYVTTRSPEAWSASNKLLGDPVAQVNDFSRRLNRASLPLEPAQRASLQQIFQEEFAHTEMERRDLPTAESPDTAADRQSRQITACYERIADRAKPVLNENQFAQFQNFKKRYSQLGENRAKEPAWNWTSPFYHLLIDLYFFIVLPLSCVRAAGALIRDELQADTLSFLTTRPLSRAQLVAAKYISHTAWQQMVFLVEAFLLFGAGLLRHIPALGALMPIFVAAQLLAVPAWTALGTFLGLVSRRYMALALVYGLIVEMGIGRIPSNINTLSLMRHLKTLLAHNPALQAICQWPGTGVPLSVGALLLASTVFLVIAMVLFTFVEYHHTAEMQK